MIRPSRWSIQTILGLLIGSVGLLLIAVSVEALLDAGGRYVSSRRIAELSVISKPLLTSLIGARVERGTIANALLGDEPIDADSLKVIGRARLDADEAYAQSIRGLSRTSLATVSDIARRLRTTHDAVAALRVRADAAMLLPMSRRDPGIVRDQPPGFQLWIDATLAASDLVEPAMMLTEPMIDQLLSVKRAAWAVRSSAGMIMNRSEGAVSSGKAWTAADALAAAVYRGQILQAWSVIRSAAARPDAPVEIVQSFARAERDFLAYFEGEQRAYITTLEAGKMIDIGFAELQRRDTVAAVAVAALAQTALSVMVERADAEMRWARIDLILHAGTLACAIAFVAGCLVTLRQRICRPLLAMTSTMRRLAERETTVDIPGIGRGDEIGAMASAMQVFKDSITAQQVVEAKIAHMAHHDALTGLANRLLFHERLTEAVARCRRGARYAVLYLDLDHFKAVNDTLGHPVGDALLREVTQRLQRQVREGDTIARLGGDEFAIVQSISQPSDSTALAKRVIEAVGAPYEFNGNRVIIGTSIGIAIVPDDGADVDEIIKNADMALYRSKADGRGRYQFFELEMNARMQARRTLDLDLRTALAEGEFRLFYQPLIDIATRAVCGFEALLRWQHPERGMVSPADFMPLAEETGLIVPIGKWVLRQACADAATWPDNLKVAVNLSPVQFGSHTLVDDVATALADARLDACRLELEITETAMLADTIAVLAILHRLRDFGLKIALDDFGTGYSSLSYLQRFPFSKVKIDRSFVAKLGHGGDNDTIVAAVIGLCNRLRMVTTGEGVETVAQLGRLASLNCVEAQGYLFSRPRPASEVAAMLTEITRRNLAEVTP